MERRKKRVICLILSCYILLLNISIVKAEALPDVMNGSATIADCVMSYYAMAGAGVANTEWINTLYDGLGSSFGTIYDFAENGMLTINSDGTWQATTALTDAIENSSAYTSLGLDQIFNISAEEAAAGGGVAAASGAATLSGAVGGVASSGLLPVLGGVTVAYWGGIAIGTLIAHMTGLYGEQVTKGVPMDVLKSTLQNIPAGAVTAFGSRTYTPNGSVYQTYYSGLGMSYTYPTSDNVYVFGIRNLTKTNITSISLKDGTVTNTNTSNSTSKSGSVQNNNLNNNAYAVGLNRFNSEAEYSSFVSDWQNGLVEPATNNYSPDLIGENGNQQGSYNPNTNQYFVPDFKPMIDSGVQSGVPLTMQDWLNFANSVSNNNSQTNPLPDNSALFDALINRIVAPLPNPNPNPDPNPNPNPDPNPDPYHPPVVTPVPDPDYDPVPDNPDQPDYESEKQKQTEPIPDNIPTGAPWTTDGLLEKFPFCIPKDMIDMVKQFSTGSRQAPYINWRFNPPGTPVDYTFNLDLSDFEDAATLIRMLELAAFIVGLAFATRYLIGAT